MKNLLSRFFVLLLLLALTASSSIAQTAPPPAKAVEARQIPDALKAWEGWATWDDEHRFCPTPFNDAKKHLCFWPSRLGLNIDHAGGRFELAVTVFHETWVPLPGSAEAWPQGVTLNGAAVPVVEHADQPAVHLAAGTHRIEGAYKWSEYPQRLALPREVGLIALTVEGKPVDAPTWDTEGWLWLRRDSSTEETDKDSLQVKVYTLLEDGIPLWLRNEVEVTVSGKSREEELGTILPAGWKLSSVESPIPVAVDGAGKLKVQVRAGVWTIRVDAFRSDNPKEIRFPEGAKPVAPEILMAFVAQPTLRMVEILGAPAIDVTQIAFPEKWRALPVHRWSTGEPLRIEERMRGMGDQKPAGLSIRRELWLDENGRGLTFRDKIKGEMQQIWRLDSAPGQVLGAVRSDGEGQLITRNPQSGAAGVEIRTRQIDLEATGQIDRAKALLATGWQSDAEALDVTLNLPPGWRLFALFGADWVQGDWLTAWTLLDLFLLLIFTLAVYRLWGVGPAVLAFLAFGLSYHEPGSPRFTWLLLLVPLALLRVVAGGWGRRILVATKWLIIAGFAFILIPFVAGQVQQALYPQLEAVRSYSAGSPVRAKRAEFARELARPASASIDREMPQGAPTETLVTREWVVPPGMMATGPSDLATPGASRGGASFARRTDAKEYLQASGVTFPPGSSAVLLEGTSRLIVRNTQENLDLVDAITASAGSSGPPGMGYDPAARIQTGPAIPDWSWRTASFGWNGPVQASQQVRPWLIPAWLERLLSLLRVALILALVVVLLNARRLGASLFRFGRKTTAALVIALLWFPLAASAQTEIPDQATLQKLRERLLKPSDAYPRAAEIPSATLKLEERRITIDAEIHTAVETAVPLPGRLPAWSPVAVLVNDKPESALLRDDGYLWVVLPQGVHRVRVEGMLANVTEWQWTFLLKPRQVTITAPGWTVTGVRPDGIPEQQVFLVRQQEVVADGVAAYDRPDVQPIVLVERELDLGLIWQVRTTVRRLSPPGKAVALRVPLIPGENVLSSNAVVKDGFIEVRLGAQEMDSDWKSGLPIASQLTLATRPEDTWVEQWHVAASPVWNIAITGLPPTFKPDSGYLSPIWYPWPGEKVELTISRPEALAGATVTVSSALHEITLGKRQRLSKLELTLRCSVGQDFLIDVPAEAQITSLSLNKGTIPVRKDGTKVIVPLHPGEQTIAVEWKTNTPLGMSARAEEVRLPVESANVQTVIQVPDDRWVLWTSGPQRGPAVRFWGILICSLLAAVALGRLAASPLRTVEWMLLVIGLTQVPLIAALLVIAWLFFLAWRGDDSFQGLRGRYYNVLQLLLIGLTAVALGILVFAVGEGLLGRPEMFISGNDSYLTMLRWYEPRSDAVLSTPTCISVSIWWYRFLMLAWALWLAAALIRWLRMGWQSFSRGGVFRPFRKQAPPPPLPGAKQA